jgi:transposase
MIPAEHPIRTIKRLLSEVLAEMDGHFDEIYAAKGRPSIPPERLLLAKGLRALYSIRSERQFCERLQL